LHQNSKREREKAGGMKGGAKKENKREKKGLFF
jgi:hypothetical protein